MFILLLLDVGAPVDADAGPDVDANVGGAADGNSDAGADAADAGAGVGPDAVIISTYCSLRMYGNA